MRNRRFVFVVFWNYIFNISTGILLILWWLQIKFLQILCAISIVANLSFLFLALIYSRHLIQVALLSHASRIALLFKFYMGSWFVGLSLCAVYLVTIGRHLAGPDVEYIIFAFILVIVFPVHVWAIFKSFAALCELRSGLPMR